MLKEERHLRADAERNRKRLLAAASALFSERGLDVGVAEIAERAGVGRGTLFRNFPTKEELIAAVVVERMRETAARGRGLLEAPDPTEALFEFLGGIVCGHQTDRVLFDAVAETFLSHQGIRAAYSQLVEVLEALLEGAQEAGSVRRDIGPVDLLMMVKGVCVASMAFQDADQEITLRALDLVRGALSTAASAQPLRGRTLTVEDLERTVPPRLAPATESPRLAPATESRPTSSPKFVRRPAKSR